MGNCSGKKNNFAKNSDKNLGFVFHVDLLKLDSTDKIIIIYESAAAYQISNYSETSFGVNVEFGAGIEAGYVVGVGQTVTVDSQEKMIELIGGQNYMLKIKSVPTLPFKFLSVHARDKIIFYSSDIQNIPKFHLENEKLPPTNYHKFVVLVDGSFQIKYYDTDNETDSIIFGSKPNPESVMDREKVEIEFQRERTNLRSSPNHRPKLKRKISLKRTISNKGREALSTVQG